YVSDHLVGLYTEAEMFGRFRNPFLDGGVFEQLAEAEVDFHRVQLAGVVGKKIFLRQLFRIKRGLPAWIGPSGGAGKELRHSGRERVRSANYILRRFFPGGALWREDLDAFFLADDALVFGRELPLISAWAAISTASGSGAAAASLPKSGNFCLSFSTGSKRSPNLSTRSNTCGASKTSRLGSFFLNVRSTSSQVTGVETVGRSRARSEYTAMVVLCSSFWLPFTKTLLVRRAFFMSDTIKSRCSCSNRRARAWAKGLVWP